MSGTGDNAYAPKSPDLSSFYSGPEVHSYSRVNHYSFPGANTSTPTGTHPLQLSAQTQVQTQVQQQPLERRPTFSQLPHPPYQVHHYNNNSRASNGSAADAATAAIIANHNAYLSQHQQLDQALYTANNPQHSASQQYHPHQSQLSGAPYFHSPAQHAQQQPPYQPPPQPSYHSQAAPPYYLPYTDSPDSPNIPGPSQNASQQPRLHKQRVQQPQQSQPPQQSQQQVPLVFNEPTTPKTHNAMPRGKAAAPVAKEPEIMESPVRTKFPTARIKRIMQADEEVGKVAQQTPIAVGKALELFMVQLVHKSAEVAKEKNSKRITAHMLKQAIDSNNEWDFLRDIVAKVTEEKEGARSGGRAKAESETDDEADAGEIKRRGRGGRKKKAAA
ncbi:hypothetical protein F4777DRAFT_364145 [Nemania sp. FL0916]|nr:hypothetical protein F4777DRAFT_364145 [Nemania sp. FL0916]